MHRSDPCNWLREKVICDPFPRLLDCSNAMLFDILLSYSLSIIANNAMLYLELAFTNTKRNICNEIFPLHVIVIGAKKRSA